MKKSFNPFVVLVIFVIITFTTSERILQKSTYATTSSRTSSVKESCGGYSRDDLVVTENQRTRSLSSTLQNFFGVDGPAVMKYYLAGQSQSAQSQVNKNVGPLILLLLPFAIGALVAIIMAPIIFICICCRPTLFRTYKFWQNDTRPFTYNETTYPGLLTLILILGVIACCIAGIVKMTQLSSAYDRSLCSRAVIFDDAINGNVSHVDQRYFAGLQRFSNEVFNFLDIFNDINKTLSVVTSNNTAIQNVNLKLNQSQSMLTNLPSGSGKQLNLQYGAPLNAEKPTRFIKSTFVSELGTVQQPKSLVGQTFSYIVSTRQGIDQVTNISDFYLKTAGPSTNQIGIVQTDIKNMIDTIYNVDRKMQSDLKDAQGGPYLITVGAVVVFSILLFISLISICTLFCFYIRKYMKTRFVLYTVIVLFYLLTLLSFVLAIVSAIGVPYSSFLCSFVDGSVSSSQDFDRNFEVIIKDKKARASISKCLPSENGSMIAYLSNDDLVKSMQALPRVTLAMSSLNAQNFQKNITQRIKIIEGRIKSVANGKQLDIKDSSSQALLSKLSLSWKYKCTAPGFDEDSWIPSLQQTQPYVPCKQGLFLKADHTTCSMGQDFEQRKAGCVGCIDTYGIFKFTNTIAQVQNALALRYSADTCVEFNKDLSNVWNNYYRVKKQALPALQKRLTDGVPALQAATAAIQDNLQPIFNDTITQLQSVAPDFVNPIYGLGAGLRCNVVGEDLQIFADNVCGLLVPRIHTMLIITGCLSFGLLLLLCFMTCTVVRVVDLNLGNHDSQQGVQSSQQPQTQKQVKEQAKPSQQGSKGRGNGRVRYSKDEYVVPGRTGNSNIQNDQAKSESDDILSSDNFLREPEF